MKAYYDPKLSYKFPHTIQAVLRSILKRKLLDIWECEVIKRAQLVLVDLRTTCENTAVRCFVALKLFEGPGTATVRRGSDLAELLATAFRVELSRGTFVQRVLYYSGGMATKIGNVLAGKVDRYAGLSDQDFERRRLVAHSGEVIVNPGRQMSSLTMHLGQDSPYENPQIKRDWMEQDWDESERESGKNWGYSLESNNVVERAVEGAGVFLKKPVKCLLDREQFKLMLIDAIVNCSPRGQTDGNEDPIYVEGKNLSDPMTEMPAKAATGFMPGFNKAVKASKDKFVFCTFTTLLHLMYLLANKVISFPPMIPYKTAFKGEVLKLEKKVRAIQVASYLWQLVGVRAVLPTFIVLRTMFFGNAIGLQFKNGGVVQVLVWFCLRLGLIYNCTIEAAKRMLMKRTFLEADKKAWEATTCKQTAWMLLFHWIGCTSFNGPPCSAPQDKESRILAGFWADYIRPYLPVGDGTAFTREGATPSGNTLTADGNTWRHIYVPRSFRIWIRRHDYHLGRVGCECPVCANCQESWLGQEVTVEQYFELAIFAVLSDDWLSLCLFKEQLKWYSDNVFGLETEDVERGFSTVNNGVIDGFEFLRGSVTDVQGTLFPCRDKERVLNKILHGASNVLITKATCVSMALQAGANERLYKLLQKLDHRITTYLERTETGSDAQELYETALEEHSAKVGDITVKSISWFPSYQDVLDFQTMGKKVERVIQMDFAYALEWRGRRDLLDV